MRSNLWVLNRIVESYVSDCFCKTCLNKVPALHDKSIVILLCILLVLEDGNGENDMCTTLRFTAYI